MTSRMSLRPFSSESSPKSSRTLSGDGEGLSPLWSCPVEAMGLAALTLHRGPQVALLQEEVSNKGGSLSSRLRAALNA